MNAVVKTKLVAVTRLFIMLVIHPWRQAPSLELSARFDGPAGYWLGHQQRGVAMPRKIATCPLAGASSGIRIRKYAARYSDARERFPRYFQASTGYLPAGSFATAHSSKPATIQSLNAKFRTAVERGEVPGAVLIAKSLNRCHYKMDYLARGDRQSTAVVKSWKSFFGTLYSHLSKEACATSILGPAYAANDRSIDGTSPAHQWSCS